MEVGRAASSVAARATCPASAIAGGGLVAGGATLLGGVFREVSPTVIEETLATRPASSVVNRRPDVKGVARRRI